MCKIDRLISANKYCLGLPQRHPLCKVVQNAECMTTYIAVHGAFETAWISPEVGVLVSPQYNFLGWKCLYYPDGPPIDMGFDTL